VPLTLVLGPANSAKAGEVLGAFADAAPRGALLVVPTSLDVDHYARELAGERAVLGTVITVAGLSGEIARRVGYAGRRLSTIQRERVLRRAIAGAELTALGRSASAQGFAPAAGNLIAELQRSLITPEGFAHALETWAAEDRRRARYAHDLAAVYIAYARELERIGRVDGELFAWRALDALRSAPGRWGGDAVFFYGFDDLTGLERDAVETLARVAGAQVTVSLTYEPGRAALSARAETVEELRPLAERLLTLPALDEHYQASSRAALHHLERGLFEPEPRPIEPNGTVCLLEAGGERAEAELVAAEVLTLLERGVAGDEIVIVHRSLDRAAPQFQHVLDLYGIPVASGHRVPFGQTALGHSVLALARCVLRERSAQDLVEYLRSPGMLDSPDIADALEATIRREGIRTAAEARARLGWELNDLDALAEALDPLGELARQARRLFALPYQGRAPALTPDQELDARALATLLDALVQLDELGETIEGGELVELLEDLQVPAGKPVRPGAVLIADPLAIRARRFQAVFVCGLQEGEFPLAGRPEPFLSDDRRRELAACAGLRLRPSEDSLARERYLFYACVSRATARLTLSYRSSDEEGNLALPSPFIADVAQLLSEEWPERRRKRLLADVVWPAARAPTPREQARSRAAAAEPPDGTVAPPDLHIGEAALSHVRHRQVVSAGALESFADCPVKWFLERELQPERFDTEPDPLTRGNYMHGVLEELLTRLEGPVTPESLPDALRMLDDVLAEQTAPLAPGRSPAVREAALQSIQADLQRYLRHEAAGGCPWNPAALELRFGFEEEEGSLPSLRLDHEVSVRGVIDRVDADRGRAIVRDYKSGSNRPERQGARWASDRQLQVPLYMLAVRELLELEPVAGLYQPLGGGDLRARGMFVKGTPLGQWAVANDGREPEELEQMLEDARERALAVAAQLRGGELEPRPSTCSRDGCRYPGICRIQ
jgi:ATP-dependent helicase/DNAse subunit B